MYAAMFSAKVLQLLGLATEIEDNLDLGYSRKLLPRNGAGSGGVAFRWWIRSLHANEAWKDVG